MSLINDALKKAQKLQSQQPPAAAPAGHALRPPGVREPESWLRPGVLLLGIAGLVVVMLAGGFIAVLLFRTPPAATPTPAKTLPVAAAPATPVPTPNPPVPTQPPPAVASAPASRPAPAAQPSSMPVRPATAPVTAPPVAPATPAPVAPPPTVSVPLASAKSAPAQPVPVETAPAAPPPVSTAAPPSAPVVEAAPAPPPEPPRNIKILAFLDKLNVTGVRVAGADSRVLMNNRVYKVNDMVDYVLGLRLVGVTSNQLTFRDDSGMTYTKSF